jgi:hypothetical protein
LTAEKIWTPADLGENACVAPPGVRPRVDRRNQEITCLEAQPFCERRRCSRGSGLASSGSCLRPHESALARSGQRWRRSSCCDACSLDPPRLIADGLTRLRDTTGPQPSRVECKLPVHLGRPPYLAAVPSPSTLVRAGSIRLIDCMPLRQLQPFSVPSSRLRGGTGGPRRQQQPGPTCIESDRPAAVLAAVGRPGCRLRRGAAERLRGLD